MDYAQADWTQILAVIDELLQLLST